MTFAVTRMEQFTPTKRTYRIENDGEYVGLAIVHYNQKRSWWKYLSPVGLLIPEASTRRAMDAAITRYHQDATLCVCGSRPQDSGTVHYHSQVRRRRPDSGTRTNRRIPLGNQTLPLGDKWHSGIVSEA